MTTETVPGRASVATLSSVASATSNQNLLAKNPNRAGVIIHNSDANAMLLKYGLTASASSYTYKVAAGAHWEMPSPLYTGPIDGIWEGDGSGAAMITELML